MAPISCFAQRQACNTSGGRANAPKEPNPMRGNCQERVATDRPAAHLHAHTHTASTHTHILQGIGDAAARTEMAPPEESPPAESHSSTATLPQNETKWSTPRHVLLIPPLSGSFLSMPKAWKEGDDVITACTILIYLHFHSLSLGAPVRGFTLRPCGRRGALTGGQVGRGGDRAVSERQSGAAGWELRPAPACRDVLTARSLPVCARQAVESLHPGPRPGLRRGDERRQHQRGSHRARHRALTLTLGNGWNGQAALVPVCAAYVSSQTLKGKRPPALKAKPSSVGQSKRSEFSRSEGRVQ